MRRELVVESGLEESAEHECAEKVEYLRRAESYPDEPGPIEVVETHFAWIFLGHRYAYKLKKPIRFHSLDFSTVEKRRLVCEAEVRLNLRLAEAVYLAAVPLTRRDGRFSLDGTGKAVDWLVKMHRLDSALALDILARQPAAALPDTRPLVSKLVQFYARAAPAPWTAEQYRKQLVASVDEWRRSILASAAGVDTQGLERLVAGLLDFVATQSGLLDERIRARRVVDGHGDLRPEHVFMTPVPQIIDCIEFAPQLRLLDAAEELSFLELECERLGNGALGRQIIDRYFEESGDHPVQALYGFGRARRALGRALICSWRLAERLSDEQRMRWQRAFAWYIQAGLQSLEVARSR